jgi:hypothetical protein
MAKAVDVRAIDDDAGLLRRIHPEQIVPDKNRGGRRLSSAAFRDPEMSVDAEPILHENGLDWKFSLREHQGYSLVRFLAREARSQGLSVDHEPVEGNPTHTEVKGRKSTSVIKHLIAVSDWVHLEPESS